MHAPKSSFLCIESTSLTPPTPMIGNIPLVNFEINLIVSTDFFKFSAAQSTTKLMLILDNEYLVVLVAIIPEISFSIAFSTIDSSSL